MLPALVRLSRGRSPRVWPGSFYVPLLAGREVHKSRDATLRDAVRFTLVDKVSAGR